MQRLQIPEWRLPGPVCPANIRPARSLFLVLRSLIVAGLSCLLAIAWGGAIQAQEPQFSQGFSGANQSATRDPDESRAYVAAIGQADPSARASAIQQFLIAFPNSSFRQAAVAQMMMAKRQAAGPTGPYGGGPQPVPQPTVGKPESAQLPQAAAPVTTGQVSAPERDSLLQHAAKRAKITVNSGSLSINADNASLTQILQDISGSTGMKVEGLAGDERIFGTYGPGDAREVLLALLDGSGYNVLMVGETSAGAPRQLTLTQREGTTAAVSPAPVTQNGSDEDDDVEQEVPQPPPPEVVIPQPTNQPPAAIPQNPEGAQPRSPQELQQEMFRIRQQQLQQQQQQQQQDQ